MQTKPERQRGYWEMFERGVLSECELVNSFVDELDIAHIDTEWSSLPEGYREIIVRYFRERLPETMPRCFVFGQPAEQEVERLTQVRQRNAAELIAYLDGQHSPPPGRDT